MNRLDEKASDESIRNWLRPRRERGNPTTREALAGPSNRPNESVIVTVYWDRPGEPVEREWLKAV